jgi:hypothetical protein
MTATGPLTDGRECRVRGVLDTETRGYRARRWLRIYHIHHVVAADKASSWAAALTET